MTKELTAEAARTKSRYSLKCKKSRELAEALNQIESACDEGKYQILCHRIKFDETKRKLSELGYDIKEGSSVPYYSEISWA